MKTFFFSALLILSTVAQAQMSDAGYLNKLSNAIRGISPSPQEYAELERSQKEGTVESFLNAKRAQYLTTPLFAEKMVWRLKELLKLNPSTLSPLLNPDLNEDDAQDSARQNSTYSLLYTLFAQNKSWDYLLTGHTYQVYKPKDEFFGTNSYLHFSQLLTEEQKKKFNEVPQGSGVLIEFPETDGRIAGVLTSDRFFARYATTAVNKNRRRAAAIFRTFLCDNMIAAVPDPGENIGKIIDIQYPKDKNQSFTEDELRAANQMSDGLHGSQADCRACHYKLDPMGKVFLGSPVILSSHEWPGALTYKNRQNELVNIPVKNVSELGQAIASQPDYVTCQIKHFWEWFIGKDVVLSQETLNQLTKQFELVGRKPLNFVNLLVQRPEFRTRKIEDPTLMVARQTKEIFRKCQSCHSGKTDDVTGEPLVDLTLWPLGQDTSEKDPQYWIQRISKKLDLPNGGRNRTMPPKTSKWSLTREDMQTIQKWIDLGTPSDQPRGSR